MQYLFLLCATFSVFLFNINAQSEINTITTGALLVRLQTNEHLINYYTSNNLLNQSEAEKIKQFKENQHIINTFKEIWSLCPVYFFYSHSSDEIQKNDFTHVFKFNHEPLTNQEKTELINNFFITYLGDSPGTLKFNALVLTNNNFQTLPAPSPKYIRTYKGLWFLKRKLEKSIKILEKKIKFAISRIQ